MDPAARHRKRTLGNRRVRMLVRVIQPVIVSEAKDIVAQADPFLRSG